MTTSAEKMRRKRALEKAGFRYVAGHLPEWQAKIVQKQIRDAEQGVDRVLNEEQQKPARKWRQSRATEGECKYCDELRERGETFAPPHDASLNCQSGGHNHCSCGTCF